MKKLGVFWLGFLMSVFPVSTFASIHVRQLFPGDVIFSMNSFGGADHVGVFSGIGSDGRPYVLHSVLGKHRSLIKGFLNSIDTSYQVFRNKKLALALSAHSRMIRWMEQRVPYDDAAATFISRFEEDPRFVKADGGPVKAHYEYARALSLPRFYRRIKYAARRSFPVLPRSAELGSSGRGLRCAESVTLAYQVEELAPYVHCLGDPKEAGGYLGHWVSDKYADEELLFVGTLEGRGELSREYLRYQEALGSRGEYWVEQPEKRLLEKCRGVGHVRFRPSVCSWNFEKNPSIEKFAENFDSCLPLDSKVTSPSVLLFHMAQDHSHWSFLGNLDLGSDAPFSAAEKELWRQQVQQQIREARLVRDHVLDRIVRSASPASPMFGPSSAGGAGGMSGGGGVPLFAELFATLALDEAIDGSLDVADGGVLRLSPLEGGSAAGGAGARIFLDGALGGDRSVSGSPGFDFFSIPSSSAPE